jgi:hypothetical protein
MSPGPTVQRHADLFVVAFDGLRQSLSVGKVIEREGNDGRQPGVGGGDTASEIIIVSAKVNVAIDGSRQDIFPRGVDVTVGDWQDVIGADAHDFRHGWQYWPRMSPTRSLPVHHAQSYQLSSLA